MKKIIIAITILIIILSIVGFFIISNKNGVQDLEGENTENQGIFGGFFPFGNNTPIDETREPSPTNNNTGSLTSVDSGGLTLNQITNTAIAGFYATSSTDGLVVRFLDQADGNMFDYDFESKEIKRVSNTTLPRVKNVVWVRDGNGFIAQYADKDTGVVKSYIGLLSTDTSSTSKSDFYSIDTTFLDNGVSNVTANQNMSKIFYTTTYKTGINGYILDLVEGTKKPSISHSFGEWIFDWTTEDTLIATSRASNLAKGGTYSVDMKSGEFKKIFGGEFGYTALLNPSQSRLVFTKVGERVEMGVFNLDTKRTNIIEGLPTPLDKCVWNNNRVHIIYCGVPKITYQGAFPDLWYQGVVQFTDKIFEIDVDKFVAREIFDPSISGGAELDVVQPQFINNNNNSFLIFINKKDSTLWSLELPNIIEELYVDDEEDFLEEEIEEEIPAS